MKKGLGFIFTSAKRFHTFKNILTLPIPYNLADIFQIFFVFISSVKVAEHQKLINISAVKDNLLFFTMKTVTIVIYTLLQNPLLKQGKQTIIILR